MIHFDATIFTNIREKISIAGARTQSFRALLKCTHDCDCAKISGEFSVAGTRIRPVWAPAKCNKDRPSYASTPQVTSAGKTNPPSTCGTHRMAFLNDGHLDNIDNTHANSK